LAAIGCLRLVAFKIGRGWSLYRVETRLDRFKVDFGQRFFRYILIIHKGCRQSIENTPRLPPLVNEMLILDKALDQPSNPAGSPSPALSQFLDTDPDRAVGGREDDKEVETRPPAVVLSGPETVDQPSGWYLYCT
jgi:hypothetical protein